MRFDRRSLVVASAIPALIACCAVSPDEEAASILSQQNVIIWDSKTKTEHFIRQASFATRAKDFGFIVPTPSVPQVTEANRQILYQLQQLDPKIQMEQYENTRRGYDSAAAAATAESKDVEVLQVKDAGPYTITTLKASNAASLEAWFKQNKYTVPADIQEWLNAYLKKGWFFSAFKFKADRVDSMEKLPCLSFKTEKPFAPYRVPKSNRKKTESLEIYFISDQPYGGFVSDKNQSVDQWSARVRDHFHWMSNEHLDKKVQIPKGSVATFLRADFPTAAPDDMVFKPIDRDVFEKPGESNPVIWIAPVALVGAAGWIALKRRK